jgi:plastocyanin
MFKRSWIVVVLAAIALSACGGGGGGGGGNNPATCSPGGTKLSITAQNISFDKDCLAAPADQAFTIAFDNKDANVPHNLAIVDGSNKLFSGEVITGTKSTTYQVKGLPAGTYQFHCDVHPGQMTGTFIVK